MAIKTSIPRVVSEELPANPFVFEVLALSAKQKSNAKKVEVLQKYEHPSLKSLFIWNFDETIISELPEGLVPYGTVGQQNVVSGNLSDNISRAVQMMGELDSNSIQLFSRSRQNFNPPRIYLLL